MTTTDDTIHLNLTQFLNAIADTWGGKGCWRRLTARSRHAEFVSEDGLRYTIHLESLPNGKFGNALVRCEADGATMIAKRDGTWEDNIMGTSGTLDLEP